MAAEDYIDFDDMFDTDRMNESFAARGAWARRPPARHIRVGDRWVKIRDDVDFNPVWNAAHDRAARAVHAKYHGTQTGRIYLSRPNFESVPKQPWYTGIVKGQWRTAQGEVLQISAMETSHIVNTMACLWRMGTNEQILAGGKIIPFYQDKIHELGAELQLRMALTLEIRKYLG